MSILVSLQHVTRYRYDGPAAFGPHVIKLRPAPHSRTRVPSYSLQVAPAHQVNWQHDPHGNWAARYLFSERAEELTVTVDLLAEIKAYNPFDFFIEPYAASVPFDYPDALRRELSSFLETEPAGPRLSSLLASLPADGRGSVEFLIALIQRLSGDIRYLVRMEPGVQSCEETLELASGSCRDTAWLLVQVLRHLGLAARFVSGYLIQLTPDVVPTAGPPGPKRDFVRPARLGRRLSAGRRLDRARSDLRDVMRRRPPAARRHAALWVRGADHRLGRSSGRRVRGRDACRARCRAPARDHAAH